MTVCFCVGAGTLICPCWIRPAPWCPSTPPCHTTQRGTWNPHRADVCIDSLIVWQNICSVWQLLLDWKTHLLIDCKSQRRLVLPPPPITRRCRDQSAHTELSLLSKSWRCDIWWSPNQTNVFCYIWRRRIVDQDVCSSILWWCLSHFTFIRIKNILWFWSRLNRLCSSNWSLLIHTLS